MEVEPGRDGYRVDRFLQARIGRLSRTRIQTIIGQGQLRFAAGPTIVRVSTRVRAGDRLVLLRPAPPEPAVPMHYVELHRDDALLVLNKPAGLPVHPTARYHRHTLTALMRSELGPDHGWQMAHRIDRETSGVLVFGKGVAHRSRRDPPSGAGLLKRAFAQRAVHKTYLAIVHGTLREAASIDIPLAFDPNSTISIKMGAVPESEGGLPAQTHVQPIEYGSFGGGPITLVRCTPRTGRQHQIRVHLAEHGFPLLGDKMYGVDEQLFRDMADGLLTMEEVEREVGLSRQALHAYELTLPHPGTGEPFDIRAPWPPLLAEVIALPDEAPR